MILVTPSELEDARRWQIIIFFRLYAFLDVRSSLRLLINNYNVKYGELHVLFSQT